MADRLADLEAKVAELSRALAVVQARVQVLERGTVRAAARRPAIAASSSAAVAPWNPALQLAPARPARSASAIQVPA